jgi:polar amino acid transport system substrate-binding protein
MANMRHPSFACPESPITLSLNALLAMAMPAKRHHRPPLMARHWLRGTNKVAGLAGTAALTFMAGCAGPGAPLSQPASATQVSVLAPALLSEIAPSGTLRAAINFGNPILATREAASGQPRGVSVDLARELARRLDMPVEFVTFESAGAAVEAVKTARVDVGFVAIDPARGADLLQTPPYVIIEGAYLVRQGSPIQANSEVDRPGNRIVVGQASAYDLFLQRELKSATLVRAPSSPQVTDVFLAQNMEVAAGVRQQLQADALRLPGLRLLGGRFMAIRQAMAVPKGREAAARYVSGFVREMADSGFVASSLGRHGIDGAKVAVNGD